MEDVENSNVHAGRNSSAWTPHVNTTRTRAELGNSGVGVAATALQQYGQANGFSVGAIKVMGKGFTHHSSSHHYFSRSRPTVTELGSGTDVEVALRNYCSGFSVNNSIMSLAIFRNAVQNRHFLISRRILNVRYLRKDTYTGGMSVTDWLFTREPASHWDINDWPRAVSNNPQNRLHIYAVEGPWTSAQANASASVTDIYGRRTRARMDLYRCTDGVYIGQPLADLIGFPIFTPLAS